MKVAIQLAVIIYFSAAAIALCGIAEDSTRALHQAKGDRLRYFKYLECARWYGVPEALDRYGVKPEEETK